MWSYILYCDTFAVSKNRSCEKVCCGISFFKGKSYFTDFFTWPGLYFYLTVGFFQTQLTTEAVLFESTMEPSANSYLITISPAVVIRNFLPMIITCKLEVTFNHIT
jgi:hypothetical protein